MVVKKGRRRFFIPKEHGAWAVLYVSFVTGIFVAARSQVREAIPSIGGLRLPWNAGVLLLFLAITFGYLSRLPFIEWLRSKYKKREAMRFFIGYASAGILAYFTLLFRYKLWWLLLFGVISGSFWTFYIYQTLKGKHHSIMGELVGVLGLTFAAPISHYVAIGSLTKMAWLLWLLNALFFSSSIFYVKLRVEAYVRKKELRTLRDSLTISRRCIIYHLLLFVFIGTLYLLQLVPAMIFVAFLPILIRGSIAITYFPKTLSLKRIGFSELAYALFFMFTLFSSFPS